MDCLRHRIVAFAAVLSVTVMSSASEPETEILRPVTAAYTVEAGSAHIADTYLSPIRYSGWSVGFGYGRMQAMKFSPERWVMALDARIDAERSLNRVGNATMWYWGVEARWAMMRRVRPLSGLTIGFGIGPGFKAGCTGEKRCVSGRDERGLGDWFGGQGVGRGLVVGGGKTKRFTGVKRSWQTVCA